MASCPMAETKKKISLFFVDLVTKITQDRDIEAPTLLAAIVSE